MATNDFDSDAMLAFFRQLGTEVDNLKTKIASLNDSGGSGMKKLTDETDRFGKTVEKHSRSIHSMREQTGGLLDFLKGPAGLAAAFIGAAKAMDVFAVGQLQLRNFALNTGFTVDAVQKMRVQLAAAGIDAGEASGQIASLGAKLTELRTHQQASSFYNALQASSPVLAEQVRLLMNQGKQQEANNVLQEAYNRGGERFKDYLVEITGKSRAAWEAGRKGMEGLLQPWKINEEAAEKYHKQMTNLDTAFTNVWTHMTNTMLDEITKQMGGVDKLDAATKEFTKNFDEFFKAYVIPTIKTTVEEFQWIVAAIEKIDAFMKSRGPQGQMKPDDFIKQQNEKKSGYDYLFGGDDDAALPKNARPRSFSPDSVETKEIQKDSNSLLRDMRDMMQKDTGEHPGPGGAGGGRGGMTFRPGMRGGGGGGGSLGPGVDTAAIPAGAGTPNDAIAAQRKPLIDEINASPHLKEKVYSMLQSEESGVGPRTATMEALLNRTLMIQKKNPSWTIAKELASGFYGPINRGELTTTRGASRAQSEAAVASAAGGSMVAQGRTDQGMAGDPNAGGPGRVRVPGTGGIFNFWKGSRPGGSFSWADSQRFADEERAIAAGGGRGSIDSSLRGLTGGDLGSANVSVDFKNMPKGVVGNASADGAFKKVQISRSPQAPAAGGAVTTFNEWAFE
jgi:hypothetical protein